jgi:NhaP-type Na+/H+ or K+/H+ antiporter
VLVYESGFNFDWHIFKRLFFQIIILAFPCVMLLAFFIQFSLKFILGYGDDYYTWESAFMFGSIISSTDTVAVLALLKDCGAGKRFISLIEGESLLNDGASMVLFSISYGVVKGNSANIY